MLNSLTCGPNKYGRATMPPSCHVTPLLFDRMRGYRKPRIKSEHSNFSPCLHLIPRMFLYFSLNPEGRLWAPGQHLPLFRTDFSSCFFIESRRAEKPGTHYAPLTVIKYKRAVSISHGRQNLILILFSETWGMFG